jgi:hypothetical protein
MLIIWLSEIWLNQLGQLKERGEEMSAPYERIQDSFRKFLAAPRIKVIYTSINSLTVASLLVDLT